MQQAALTETRLAVPTLSTTTNPTLRSSSTWCEQVDWLMPERGGEVADAHRRRPARSRRVCSSRTRVGSASTANHSA